MTLLVGAMFPWESLLQHRVFGLVEELGFQIQRGVILAADSRWTHRSGARQDNAVKLFPVGTDGLAAYAGSVAIGEDAIKELCIRLPERDASTIDEVNVVVTQIIRSVWARYAAFGERRLQVLLGVSDANGGCWLIRFSDRDAFRAHPVSDMELIGPQSAREHFRRVLRDMVEEQLARSSHSLSVESWAGLVAWALYDTCERQAHAFVGGNVQYASTSAGQAKAHGLYRLRPERMDLGAQQLTIDPSQGHALRKWQKHGASAGDPR